MPKAPLPKKKPVAKKPSPAKEKVKKEAPVVEAKKVTERPVGSYLYAVGRRKTSTAQVRLFTDGSGSITVNQKPFAKYFPTMALQKTLLEPLVAVGYEKKVNVEARARGGGVVSQAGAVRHGIARALLLVSADFRTVLKKSGFLTRDSRMKERKKPGLKRARRAPQFSKR